MRVAISLVLAMVSAFGRGHTAFHPTAFAPYTFDNTIVRLHFNVTRGIVYGAETAIVRAKRRGLRTLPFNSLGIHYQRISVNGRNATYSFDAQRQLITVVLPSPVAAGTRLKVEFTYWAAPQRGIYFIRPDNAYPDITQEIWSQGETTDNRRWFPTWDEPNEKTPSELVVTVPRGWTVVANGYLQSHTHTTSVDTWDWISPRPKSTYLIAFAAGPLSREHTTAGSLDVDSYVQPPYASLNGLCFSRANSMVRYYEQIIGVKYPFEKYDQTTAERFTFGGMENSSAAILTDLALHPAIDDDESSCDLLISHELAQNWWGDDVTMADWSNVWINEGFATYFDELWTEKRFGEASFEYARFRAAEDYFAETRKYFRPIVDYVYNNPLDLFDVSGHERPAQALHMLRYMFGDARFFSALHSYLAQYQYRNANTHQFFNAIGAALGTDLHGFENEWFYRADYPHYFVTDSYNAAKHTLTLRVRQKNRDGRPFQMPVVIEAFWDGHVASVEPTIDRNDQVLTISHVVSKPLMVLFDPNSNILRELTFPKSNAELTYQLAYARHVGDREWALEQLAKKANAKAIDDAVRSDAFYGIRADAAAAAATLGDANGVATALHDKDKRVRLAAAIAAQTLGGRPEDVVDALQAMKEDPDPNVVADVLAALGALKVAGIYKELVASLDRPSFRQTIAAGALRGLAAYGDVRALSIVAARTAYGTQEQERNAAVGALAELAKHTQKQQLVLPILLSLLEHDPLIGTRIAAARALGSLGDRAAVPALRRSCANDPQLIVQIAAWNAMAAIASTQQRD